MTMLKIKKLQYRDWVSLIMGAAATITGASLFNVADDFRRILFPQYEKLVSTILAIYFTAVSGSSLFFTHFRVDHRVYLFSAQVGNLVTACFIPVVCFIKNASSATLLLCVLTAFLGVFIALSLSSAIGLGANNTDVEIGSLAAGFGLSGCISFFFWMLFAHGIFKGNDRTSASSSISALFLVCIVLSILNLTQYTYLIKHEPQSHSHHHKSNSAEDISELEQLEANSKQDSMVSRPSSYSSLLKPGERNDGQYIELLRKAWPLLILRFISFFETFVTFPYVAPRGWKPTRLQGSLLVGFFQVTDFCGRYAPVCVPQLLMNQYGVFYGCLLKLILILVCYLTAMFRTISPFDVFFFRAILLVLLAFTNGWFTSCCTIWLPQCLSSSEGKSRASALGLCLSFIGIATGMWVSMTLSYLLV